MALTDEQTEVLARDLLTIARCARTLHADIEPKRPTVGDDGAWHRPTYGPKAPCDVRIVSLLDEAGRLLGWYLGRIAADFITTPLPDDATPPGRWAATRDRTTHDKANRLWEQRGFAATAEWATEFLDDMTRLAQKLADAAEPPPPTKPPTIPREEVFATAGDLAPVVSDITGKHITRKQITYWGRAGYIACRGGAGDEQVYRLADVLDHAQKE